MKLTFKTFLSEKTMNTSVYKDALKRLDNDAKIGFEFEFVVPESAIGKQEAATDYLRSYDFNDLTHLSDYFDIDRNTFRQIEREYDEWFEQNMKQWIENNYSDYEEPSTEDEIAREKDARSAAEARFNADNSRASGDYSIDEWFSDVYSSKLSDLFNEFGIEPQYGWADERRGAFYTEDSETRSAIEHVVDLMNRQISRTVRGNPLESGYRTWGVVEDSSVTGTDDQYGVEVVSPPMKPSKAIYALKDMFDFIGSNDFETNSTCGLHINISVPDMAKKLDPLKLMLFMGEKHVLNIFERGDNIFARPLFLSLLQKVRDSGFMSTYPKEFITAMQDELMSSGKNHTANLSKLIRNGYVEFRVAGGNGYHRSQKEKEVISLIGRFLAIIELAIDPEAERQEYMKKVGKLMNALRKNAAPSDSEMSTYATGPKEIIAPLKRLIVSKDVKALALGKAARISDALSGKSSARVLDIYDFIKYVYMGAYGIGVEPDIKEIVHLKKLIKQMGISQKQLQDHFAADQIDAINISYWNKIGPMIRKDFKL